MKSKFFNKYTVNFHGQGRINSLNPNLLDLVFIWMRTDLDLHLWHCRRISWQNDNDQRNKTCRSRLKNNGGEDEKIWWFSKKCTCLTRRAGNLLICSFSSNKMSDCELFTQIAQDKWATMSESLRLLRGNERPWANCSGHSRQMRDHERFAQVAQRKWANERFAQKNLAKQI